MRVDVEGALDVTGNIGASYSTNDEAEIQHEEASNQEDAGRESSVKKPTKTRLSSILLAKYGVWGGPATSIW
jgi:hypothetical protein